MANRVPLPHTLSLFISESHFVRDAMEQSSRFFVHEIPNIYYTSIGVSVFIDADAIFSINDLMADLSLELDTHSTVTRSRVAHF